MVLHAVAFVYELYTILLADLEQANEENSLAYFEGMDAYFTCFGTTRANAGSNVCNGCLFYLAVVNF